MRTLITGGAGFIGSHLADRLVARGDHVTLIDNISTGRIENVAHLLRHDRVRLIIDSACNAPVMEELIRDADHVYHLAAPVGVEYILANPVRAILDNVRAADVVFRLCNKYRRRVLLASSSEVYGRNLEMLPEDGRSLSEEDYRLKGSTKNHRWAYASTKSLDEFLGFAYYREYRLPVVVVRFFNTVGPRQSGAYGMVIPRFVEQALSGRAITIFGTGRQTRSFLHVDDALDAIIALMEHDEAVGDVFNVGHGSEITIRALAEAVVERTGCDVPIQTIPYEQAYGDGFEDMLRRTPDISKVTALLGFRPRRDLEATLDDVIASTRHKLGIVA